MTLGEAIRRALAVQEPVGLLGQLMWLARNTDEGRAGRPASAAGVSAATWNRWMSHARSGAGNGPSAVSRAKLRATIRSHTATEWTLNPPTKLTVTAEIEWNGYINPVPVRTTTLDGLDTRELIHAFTTGNDKGMEKELQDITTDRYGCLIEIRDVVYLVFNT
jgi:hypothetical protein